jgi:2-oxoisovalerate dehydrogenase E1 component
VPVPEIQYLAYLHHALDQIRGEAATMQFFSNGQYRNGMVVRVASFGYQKGFGGHFHNDSSLAALRDIPGLVVAAPSRAGDAAAMLRTLIAAARVDGTVSVFCEPIALYHSADLLDPGDDEWTDHYVPPSRWTSAHVPIGSANLIGMGTDLLIVTFANGVHLSMRALRRLAEEGVSASILDLRWLSPLPVADLLSAANEIGKVLVVDETRHSGGVGEGVIAALVEGGFAGPIHRVASADSFVPLGDAAFSVLVSEDQIVEAAFELARR